MTAATFRILGQQPPLGRDFADFDHVKGAEVILGYTSWKNRYTADRNVLGRQLRVNGQPAAIVGVMPDGMKFPTNSDMWAPFVPTPDQERRSNRPLALFGRLRDGANRPAA